MVLPLLLIGPITDAKSPLTALTLGFYTVHGSTTLYKTPIPTVNKVAAAATATVDVTDDSATSAADSMNVDSGGSAGATQQQQQQQQQQRGIVPAAVFTLRSYEEVRTMYTLLHQRCSERAATLQARIAAAAIDTTADTTASADTSSSSSDAVEGGLAAAGQQVAAEQMKAQAWIGDLPTKLRANAAPRFTHEEDNVLLGTLTRVIDTVYEKPVSCHLTPCSRRESWSAVGVL
eukprot:15824-Heterococcus_DN1.PRE.4